MLQIPFMLLILTAVIGLIVIFPPLHGAIWCHVHHKQQRTGTVKAAIKKKIKKTGILNLLCYG